MIEIDFQYSTPDAIFSKILTFCIRRNIFTTHQLSSLYHYFNYFYIFIKFAFHVEKFYEYNCINRSIYLSLQRNNRNNKRKARVEDVSKVITNVFQM